AREPSMDETGRRISVIREKLPMVIGPLEYLLRSGMATAGHPPSKLVGWIDFGPTGGLLLTGTRFVRRPDGQTIELKDAVACTILPWREAVTVRLEGFGPLEFMDEQIVRQVAASLATGNAPLSPAETAQTTLEGGIHVRLPDGFKLLVEND